MAATRTLIELFILRNPTLANATVYFRQVDSSGVKVADSLVTLYAATSGTLTVTNPVQLNEFGQLTTPVYIDAQTIAEIHGVVVPDHDTGVISPPDFTAILNGTETVQTYTLATGSIAIDFQQGKVIWVEMNGAVTVGDPSNVPAAGLAGTLTFFLVADGTNDVTWPSTFNWGAASAPDLTAQAAGTVVQVEALYVAGERWFARTVQTGFAS